MYHRNRREGIAGLEKAVAQLQHERSSIKIFDAFEIVKITVFRCGRNGRENFSFKIYEFVSMMGTVFEF